MVHLPLAFNERWTHEAIAKYMRSSRAHAPYLPSNVDFVAANNGARPLQSIPYMSVQAGYVHHGWHAWTAVCPAPPRLCRPLAVMLTCMYLPVHGRVSGMFQSLW